jgi:hypothetical protein
MDASPFSQFCLIIARARTGVNGLAKASHTILPAAGFFLARFFVLLFHPFAGGRVLSVRDMVLPASGAVPVAGAFELFAGAVSAGFLHERPPLVG